MSINDIKRGSIVKYPDFDGLYVVTDIQNNETMESMGIDRIYWITPYTSVCSTDYIPVKYGTMVKVCYTEIPFELVSDVAPFKFEIEHRYHVTQMKEKVVTTKVWE